MRLNPAEFGTEDVNESLVKEFQEKYSAALRSSTVMEEVTRRAWGIEKRISQMSVQEVQGLSQQFKIDEENVGSIKVSTPKSGSVYVTIDIFNLPNKFERAEGLSRAIIKTMESKNAKLEDFMRHTDRALLLRFLIPNERISQTVE